MPKQTFTEIRNQYPLSYLLLVDYEGIRLPDGRIEVVAAESVQSFETGDQMMEGYKMFKGSGKKVMFCTPEYKERLVIDVVPAMRIFG